jgi:hypothetical protein
LQVGIAEPESRSLVLQVLRQTQSSADGGGLEGFDEDDFGQFLADGEAGIADLADVIGVAGEESNDLVLAEADFTQAILHFRGSAKLFHADGDAGFNTAQGTEFAPGFIPV